MAQTITVPSRDFAPGVYEVDLTTLPGNSEGCEVSFSRESWPVGLCAQIDVYMSRDKGATWGHVMGGQLHGGTTLHKDGSVATHSWMLFTWPGEAGPNGRVTLRGSDVRVRAEVFQTFRTSVTITSITHTGK